jgi:serine-protein kinase ATM
MRISSSDNITRNFLDPAIEGLRERAVSHDEISGRVFFEYATFCIAQVEDSHSVSDIERMKNLHKDKEKQASKLDTRIQEVKEKKDTNLLKSLEWEHTRVSKLKKMDKNEWDRLVDGQNNLLKKGVEHFLRCFSACANYDHYISKFCSIWLKHSAENAVNTVVKDGLDLVPSYKFIPLFHQLCSRLSAEGNVFQDNLRRLLARLLNDHPYHSVYQMLNTIRQPGKESDGEDSATVLKGRSTAARELMDNIKDHRRIDGISIKQISSNLEVQFNRYLALTVVIPVGARTTGTETRLADYPTVRNFRQLAEFSLPPPTYKIAISPNRDYAGIPHVTEYDKTVIIVGGRSRPITIGCCLSDGNRFKELVRPCLINQVNS